jgi:hypothetical protein
MNLSSIMNFDQNEVERICKTERCFLNPMKKKKSEAASYLNFDGAT